MFRIVAVALLALSSISTNARAAFVYQSFGTAGGVIHTATMQGGSIGAHSASPSQYLYLYQVEYLTLSAGFELFTDNFVSTGLVEGFHISESSPGVAAINAGPTQFTMPSGTQINSVSSAPLTLVRSAILFLISNDGPSSIDVSSYASTGSGPGFSGDSLIVGPAPIPIPIPPAIALVVAGLPFVRLLKRRS